MERASSAEEAVTILGELIDEHGYTTYGGNSHMFAGEDEGWVEILTDYTNERALTSLQLGNHLLDDVLEKSRADNGLHYPDVDQSEGSTASARSESMVLDGVAARDRVNCDVGGGWAEGNTVERAGGYGDSSNVPDFSAATISGHSEFNSGSGSNAAQNWTWAAGGFLLGGFAVGLVLVLLAKRRS